MKKSQVVKKASNTSFQHGHSNAYILNKYIYLFMTTFKDTNAVWKIKM